MMTQVFSRKANGVPSRRGALKNSRREYRARKATGRKARTPLSAARPAPMQTRA
jgi:hypothetical protein